MFYASMSSDNAVWKPESLALVTLYISSSAFPFTYLLGKTVPLLPKISVESLTTTLFYLVPL